VFASGFRHDVFEDQDLPSAEYAKAARSLCDESGALLIVDDVRAGFRLARDCSWSLVGVQPDLSAWGKAIANGYALSALAGSEKARGAAGWLLARQTGQMGPARLTIPIRTTSPRITTAQAT